MTSVNKFFFLFLGLLFLGQKPQYADPLDLQSVLGKSKQKILAKFLDEYPKIASKDVTLTVSSRQDMSIPKESKSWKLHMQEGAHYLGNTVVSLSYFDQSDTELKRVTLIFQLKAKGHFTKAKQVLYRDDIVSTANAEDVLEDIEGKPFAVSPPLERALGKRVMSTIAKGAVLTDALLKPVPLIKQGDKVLIILKKQNIELKFKGDALQDAQKGGRIKVRTTLPDHKVLEGEVVDSKNVEVRLLD